MRKLAPVLLALALALAAARAGDDASDASVVCPLDGQSFSVPVTVSSNEAGGRDSDGCRWAVDKEGRLEVLELREIVACPRCKAAFYRGHLEAIRARNRRASEAPIASALAAAGPLDTGRLETAVAHAVATYRALGGVSGDPEAIEGRLWLRAAWAVRQRLVRDDEGPPLPIVFAPRSAAAAADNLSDLERQSLSAAPGMGAGTPVEDALGSLDQARSVLDPLDKDREPSRRLAFERVRGALDLVEQTLLVLRANLRTDREVDLTGRQAREFALAIARAAHRAGDGVRREQWLLEATRGDVAPDIRASAERLRGWARSEEFLLGLASAALERASERAEGDRKAALLALAADAERRRITEPASEHVAQARALAVRAAGGSGPGARHAAFLLERLGR